jgi:hypothetical protein
MGNFRVLYSLAFLFALNAFTAEKPREELMVVQTVSKNRHSFVVSKGIKDGILKGQEIIYSNQNVSILCKAIEVNRNYSLWTPIDKNVNVPFNKDEFVSYNSYAYGNVSLDLVSDVHISDTEFDYNLEYKKFRSTNNFSLKASFDQGLSQSSSEVSTDQNTSPTGYSFGAEYNIRYSTQFEISVGARIDNVVYRLASPQLDIPTSRTMATIAGTYHFLEFTKDKNNFYLTLAAGIGKSTTTTNEIQSTGIVTLLPEVRLGYLMPYSTSLAMFLEGSVESLSSQETFPDKSKQDTNVLNSKFTFGLRF